MEGLSEAIVQVATTGEGSEVTLLFSEETVNDKVAESLVGTTINAGMVIEVTVVDLNLQSGNLIAAELTGKMSSGFGVTIRVQAQVSIQAGKPAVEIIEANVPANLIADAITGAVDTLLIQLTQTETGDDENVDIEFTDIIIQDDELTLVVVVKPKA
ncbi:MAG: hypothetical protein CL873_03695 [Dehalococcoidales bacterium]|nr:hypothetical protein [Dehalococcoidales bacterium]